MVVHRADRRDADTFEANHRKLAMLRFDAHERNDGVASMHDAACASLQADHDLAPARRMRDVGRDARRFPLSRDWSRGLWWLMMTPGAKRSQGKARRVEPNAERRLRTSFPEVWAWYELLVSARGHRPVERTLDEAPARRRANR